MSSKSIYGTTSNKKPIYGINYKKPEQCNPKQCVDMFPTNLYFDKIKEISSVLIDIIDKMFPSISAKAQVEGNISAKTRCPPELFCRLIWAHKNPGDVFKNTELQIIQLKQIYLQYGFDWRIDPWLPRLS